MANNCLFFNFIKVNTMAILNFDATQVDPIEAMEAIPAGWYNAMIDESEIKPTKNGEGSYLQIRFTILDGQYAKRKVYTCLNINNKNASAQEIAYRQLSAIAHAIGDLQIQDSQQLHGKPMKIRVTFQAATGEYEASNGINGFKSINEVTGTQPGVQQTASPAWANQAAPVNNQPAPQQWQQPTAPQPWAQPATQPAAQPVQQAPNPPQQAPVPPPPVQQQPPSWQNVPAQNSAPQPAPVQQAAPVQVVVAPQGPMPDWMKEAQAAQGANPPWVQ